MIVDLQLASSMASADISADRPGRNTFPDMWLAIARPEGLVALVRRRTRLKSRVAGRWEHDKAG